MGVEPGTLVFSYGISCVTFSCFPNLTLLVHRLLRSLDSHALLISAKPSKSKSQLVHTILHLMTMMYFLSLCCHYVWTIILETMQPISADIKISSGDIKILCHYCQVWTVPVTCQVSSVRKTWKCNTRCTMRWVLGSLLEATFCGITLLFPAETFIANIARIIHFRENSSASLIRSIYSKPFPAWQTLPSLIG